MNIHCIWLSIISVQPAPNQDFSTIDHLYPFYIPILRGSFQQSKEGTFNSSETSIPWHLPIQKGMTNLDAQEYLEDNEKKTLLLMYFKNPKLRELIYGNNVDHCTLIYEFVHP